VTGDLQQIRAHLDAFPVAGNSDIGRRAEIRCAVGGSSDGRPYTTLPAPPSMDHWRDQTGPGPDQNHPATIVRADAPTPARAAVRFAARPCSTPSPRTALVRLGCCSPRTARRPLCLGAPLDLSLDLVDVVAPAGARPCAPPSTTASTGTVCNPMPRRLPWPTTRSRIATATGTRPAASARRPSVSAPGSSHLMACRGPKVQPWDGCPHQDGRSRVK